MLKVDPHKLRGQDIDVWESSPEHFQIRSVLSRPQLASGAMGTLQNSGLENSLEFSRTLENCLELSGTVQ